ncbi:hypothetical protein I309_06632 [Cryptococcus deuterogattii LA55]|nr:hypothetical protein I309_06632 [Cryptococcus deuterogattii LA55]
MGSFRVGTVYCGMTRQLSGWVPGTVE